MCFIGLLKSHGFVMRFFSDDIRGQYSGLLRLFEYGGFPPTNREASLLQLNFLFLGDHVERR